MADRFRQIAVGDTYTRATFNGGRETHVVHCLYQGEQMSRVLRGETIPEEEGSQSPDFGVWGLDSQNSRARGIGGSQTLEQLKVEQGRWGRRLTADQFATFVESLGLGDTPTTRALRNSYGTSRRIPR